MGEFGDTIDSELLDRYLAEECTSAEVAAVRAYLASHLGTTELVACMQQLSPGESVAVESIDIDARLAAVKTPARYARAGKRGSSTRHVLPWRMSAVLRPSVFSAASILLVAAAAMVAWQSHLHRAPQALVQQGEYVTGRGERANIQLADGSRIILGVDSKLRYAQPFGDRDRSVFVEGEAYFDVAHDPSKPFIVYAANSATQVLGTAFAVKAYPGMPIVQVVVVEGKVALRPRTAALGSGTTLVRGELGRIDTAGLATMARDVDLDSYTSWTRGQLTFRLAKLGDVARELERWYNITIVLADPTLASATLSISFDTESVDQAVLLLSDALNLAHTRRGQIVTLSSLGQ